MSELKWLSTDSDYLEAVEEMEKQAAEEAVQYDPLDVDVAKFYQMEVWITKGDMAPQDPWFRVERPSGFLFQVRLFETQKEVDQWKIGNIEYYDERSHKSEEDNKYNVFKYPDLVERIKRK